MFHCWNGTLGRRSGCCSLSINLLTHSSILFYLSLRVSSLALFVTFTTLQLLTVPFFPFSSRTITPSSDLFIGCWDKLWKIPAVQLVRSGCEAGEVSPFSTSFLSLLSSSSSLFECYFSLCLSLSPLYTQLKVLFFFYFLIRLPLSSAFPSLFECHFSLCLSPSPLYTPSKLSSGQSSLLDD